MTPVRRRPERVSQALLLAAVGGFLDAYTFIGHGGVFANAQTGNLVLIGVDATARHWHAALLHGPAIAAFLLGLGTTEILARPWARRRVRRPTRVVLASEILVLAVLGALSDQASAVLVTALVSFVAALQVGTFRKVGETPYGSTLTTANLRNLVSGVFAWMVDGESAAGRDARRLATVIVAFAVGAALGALLTRHIGAEASWPAAGGLVVVLGLVWVDSRREAPGPAAG